MPRKAFVLIACVPFLALIYSVVFRRRGSRRSCKCVRPEGPCTVVLTGATGGIGKELLAEFLRQDCKVIIGVRDMEKARQVAEHIRKFQVPHCGEIVILWLDLSFMKSIRQFVEQVGAQEDRVDILVNNAAVYDAGSRMNLTVDGFEQHFQVNYLGPLLLTELLLPIMTRNKDTSEARIVNITSSLAYRVEEPFPLEDINFAHSMYTPEMAYARSKYSLNLYTVALNRRVSNQKLRVMLIHPGVVITDMHRRRSPNAVLFFLWRGLGMLLYNSAWRAAGLIAHLCLCRKLKFQENTDIMYKLDRPERLDARFVQEKFSEELDKFSRRVCLLDPLPTVFKLSDYQL